MLAEVDRESLIGKRDAALLLLGCATAARASELAAVNIGDVIRLPAVAEFDHQGEVPNRQRCALARRSLSKPDEIAHYLACAPLETTVEELGRIAGMRWAIEQCFQVATNDCAWISTRSAALWAGIGTSPWRC